ncbi:sigma-70 family RNA polymerase sigma factor [Actinoplanes subtropicus]|uniref:sigma-70 family RNA polymerase sigma factor n=1 Tax=Actinoplanes subtropicus TaxID=543632 RepID=UPI0004C3EBBF|nr:sigma-70 family RNA polymerase sigma factor [Actinoplanes subtropicus]
MNPSAVPSSVPSSVSDEALVIAARAGGQRAMNELARRHLPMVYRLVRQALGADPAVDDVAQDVMVRALRQLPALLTPGGLRPWLAAIAVRQIGSHLSRAEDAARLTPLDEAYGRPDAGAEVEGPALLRMQLSAQRRQVGHAVRWLAADERAAFSLWWLETAGELTRAEVAAALGTSVAHTGVRIQRMRARVETGRQIVAALEAMPGCDALGEVAADWDGAPNAYWRKRLGRHVSSCPACARVTGALVPTDRLLAGAALLPGPATKASGVLAWLAAHPVAAAVTAGALAVGIAVPATTGWPAPARLTSWSGSPPASSDGVLRAGPVSLESASAAGRYIAVDGDSGVLAAAGRSSDAAARERASLTVVAGLADASCFSLRGPDGRYLRHSSYRLRLSPDEGTVLFRQDATFCARPGSVAGSVALESVNYPGYALRHIGDQMWLDQYDGPDDSFFVRPALG